MLLGDTHVNNWSKCHMGGTNYDTDAQKSQPIDMIKQLVLKTMSLFDN